jgi:hypothetical protein
MKNYTIITALCAALLLMPACTEKPVDPDDPSAKYAVTEKMEANTTGVKSVVRAFYTFYAPTPGGLYPISEGSTRDVMIALFKGVPPYVQKWVSRNDDTEFEPLETALQVLEVKLKDKDGAWEIYRKSGDPETKLDAIEVLVPDEGYYIDYRFTDGEGRRTRYSNTIVVQAGDFRLAVN